VQQVSALQLDYRLLKARFRKGLCELALLQLDSAAQTLATCRGEGIDDEVCGLKVSVHYSYLLFIICLIIIIIAN